MSGGVYPAGTVETLVVEERPQRFQRGTGQHCPSLIIPSSRFGLLRQHLNSFLESRDHRTCNSPLYLKEHLIVQWVAKLDVNIQSCQSAASASVGRVRRLDVPPCAQNLEQTLSSWFAIGALSFHYSCPFVAFNEAVPHFFQIELLVSNSELCSGWVAMLIPRTDSGGEEEWEEAGIVID